METLKKSEEKRTRYALLDAVRGATFLSMVLYHTLWDLTHLFGQSLPWYRGTPGYLWQQSICWSFILLSGFCWPLGRRHGRRGLLVFFCGGLITAATVLFVPEGRVYFGVLSLLGFSMLALIPLDRLFQRIPAGAGVLLSFLAFFLTRDCGRGALGFEGLRLFALPRALYANWLTAGLGFPMKGFFSADYFPVIPWFFLYLTGYFLFRYVRERGWLPFFQREGPSFLRFPGRNSLILYMLHQPVIYGFLSLLTFFEQNT